MKIQFVSDLHLEMGYNITPMLIPQLGDVLVLAGDIHTGLEGLKYAIRHSEYFDHVIYILGNHEYYGKDIVHLTNMIRAYGTPSNVHCLLDSSVLINDVWFYGTTLWSKIAKVEEITVSQYLNDYYRITKNTINNFSIQDSNELYDKSLAGIELFTRQHKNDKTCVVTHHLPSYACIHKKYSDSQVNSAFASNAIHTLSHVPDVWIHGHTHTSVDVKIDNCRVVANPRGYSGYNGAENGHFDLTRTIEL